MTIVTIPAKTYDTQIASRRRAASLLIQASTLEILLALRFPRLRDQSNAVSHLAARARTEAYEINSTLPRHTRLWSEDVSHLHTVALSIASARRHDHHREAEAIQRDAIHKVSTLPGRSFRAATIATHPETAVTAHDHFRFYSPLP